MGLRRNSPLALGMSYALLVVLSLLLVSASFKAPGAVKAAREVVWRVFSVVEWPVLRVEGFFRGLSERLLAYDRLKEENAILLSQVLELRSRLLEMGYRAEGAGPRADRMPAKVRLRPADRWWEEIYLDRGRRDGLSGGEAVVMGDALVGQVRDVFEDYSRAVLITSASFLLPVVVMETRDMGVIAGDGWGRVWLDYVPLGSSVSVGHGLYTPVVLEGIPPGVFVGRVAGPGELRGAYVRYPVELGARVSNLVLVSVLKRHVR